MTPDAAAPAEQPTGRQGDHAREELRALAEAATPGPWRATGRSVRRGRSSEAPMFAGQSIADTSSAHPNWPGCPWHAETPEGQREPDAAYIAAVDPTTVLELLDLLDARDARYTALVESIERWFPNICVNDMFNVELGHPAPCQGEHESFVDDQAGESDQEFALRQWERAVQARREATAASSRYAALVAAVQALADEWDQHAQDLDGGVNPDETRLPYLRTGVSADAAARHLRALVADRDAALDEHDEVGGR